MGGKIYVSKGLFSKKCFYGVRKMWLIIGLSRDDDFINIFFAATGCLWTSTQPGFSSLSSLPPLPPSCLGASQKGSSFSHTSYTALLSQVGEGFIDDHIFV